MFSSVARSLSTVGAKMSTVGGVVPESFSGGVQLFHWVTGGLMMGCVGTVLVCQRSKDKDLKGKLMWAHKSCGTLSAMLIAPRLIVRLASKSPAHLPGSTIEKFAADAAHWALYGLAVFLPASGVAMGYFGGKGLPFFFTTIPGAAKPDGSIAKPAFQYHKLAGQALEYMIPLHIGAAFFHAARGHKVFSRILPIGK